MCFIFCKLGFEDPNLECELHFSCYMRIVSRVEMHIEFHLAKINLDRGIIHLVQVLWCPRFARSPPAAPLAPRLCYSPPTVAPISPFRHLCRHFGLALWAPTQWQRYRRVLLLQPLCSWCLTCTSNLHRQILSALPLTTSEPTPNASPSIVFNALSCLVSTTLASSSNDPNATNVQAPWTTARVRPTLEPTLLVVTLLATTSQITLLTSIRLQIIS